MNVETNSEVKSPEEMAYEEKEKGEVTGLDDSTENKETEVEHKNSLFEVAEKANERFLDTLESKIPNFPEKAKDKIINGDYAGLSLTKKQSVWLEKAIDNKWIADDAKVFGKRYFKQMEDLENHIMNAKEEGQETKALEMALKINKLKTNAMAVFLNASSWIARH